MSVPIKLNEYPYCNDKHVFIWHDLLKASHIYFGYSCHKYMFSDISQGIKSKAEESQNLKGAISQEHQYYLGQRLTNGFWLNNIKTCGFCK